MSHHLGVLLTAQACGYSWVQHQDDMSLAFAEHWPLPECQQRQPAVLLGADAWVQASADICLLYQAVL